MTAPLPHQTVIMEIAGYLSSIIIGVSLGLIGGGGSILTVPVLVYLFAVDAVAATAYSLFIVGLTSAVGSVGYFRKGLVNTESLLLYLSFVQCILMLNPLDQRYQAKTIQE